MSSRVLVLAGVCAVLLAPHPRISHAAQSAVGAISEELLAPLRYREIGPTRQGRRVVAIATSRQNPKRFFVGAGPDGMWQTVNEGHTFEPIFDHENTTSIGHVAVAPSDDSIVWVGTGEANLRNSTYYGDGVYKSADGGSSWTNMGLAETQQIGKVIIHPDNPDIVYVAAQGQYYTDNPERGVYKTSDGGRSWTQSLAVTVDDGRGGKIHVGATDLVMDPATADTLYATTYQRIRRPWGFSNAGVGSRIHKTTDGGGSWTVLEGGLPVGVLGKIGLAIFPGTPRTLYAIVEDANTPGMPLAERQAEIAAGKPASGGTLGNILYRTDDAGASWRQVSEGSVGGRANYYGQVIVDPNDADRVFVLSSGADLSEDGGRTWRRAFRYAGDNHVLWIDPADSNHMMLGYDYGFATTNDAGANWVHADELPLAQLYAIGVDTDYPYNVYGGLQDFGSWRGPSSKKGRFPIRFEDWEHMQGGDGFYNLVDPTNSRWLYSSSQFGGLSRVDQKTGVRRSISLEDDDKYRFNWNTPLLISPHNSNVLYYGANALLRLPYRGERWQEISPDLTNNDTTKFGGLEMSQYGTLTTIAESPVQQGVLWAGSDDGNVHVSRDGGESWTNVDDRIPDNPEYWVTRIIASQHDAGTAYLAYTGRHHTDSRSFPYRTEDFGESWTSVAANLPEEPVNVIREDRKNRDLLFVGTYKSVYVSLDRGASWTRMKNNLPTIPVLDLVIHPRENDLVVGTFGRGFWITDISPLQELTADVRASDVHLFDLETRYQWVMPSQPAVSAQNFEGENEPYGVAVNYWLGSATGEVKIVVYDGTRAIHELSGPGHAGLNTVQWVMTERTPRSAEGIARWDRRFGPGAGDDDEEFFDYYDTVDYFGAPTEEVSANGLSRRTRVHDPGPLERDWGHHRVQPGEYTIVLSAAGRSLTKNVRISAAHWYEK